MSNSLSVTDIVDQVRSHAKVRVVGGGTKGQADLLGKSNNTLQLSMKSFCGILEYEPSEFTITAKAGTPVADLQSALALHGQFLPFDPPLIHKGSTLGGMMAAGISGPCRLRFGGVRDFVLGVRMIDGLGNVITGGGKVVKNAAGFDLPKLMIGSWGMLGVILESTFKVFPKPQTHISLRIPCSSMIDALNAQKKIVSTPIEMDAVDIDLEHGLLVRLGGSRDATMIGANRLLRSASLKGEIIEGASLEESFWVPLQEWTWHASDRPLARLIITPSHILQLDSELAKIGCRRRYSVAGNVAWVELPSRASIEALDQTVKGIGVRGRILLAPRGIDLELGGPRNDWAFSSRIFRALDPNGKFSHA